MILRALTWGGVLLIPRSADEWKEGQTHMHVRLASIHSLASSGGGGGVNTKPTRGRSDSLPDSDMHCLPVSPTTKCYFGSLEGLMLVTTNFFLCCLRQGDRKLKLKFTKKKKREKKERKGIAYRSCSTKWQTQCFLMMEKKRGANEF